MRKSIKITKNKKTTKTTRMVSTFETKTKTKLSITKQNKRNRKAAMIAKLGVEAGQLGPGGKYGHRTDLTDLLPEEVMEHKMGEKQNKIKKQKKVNSKLVAEVLAMVE